MQIGIISECRIKPRNPFKRYRRELIFSEKNPFELIIVRIPYTINEIDKISPRRIERAALKAEKILKKSGADKIIFSNLLRKYSGVATDSINQIFYTLIPHCIRSIAPKCNIFSPDCRICIKTAEMDRITERLATELCYDTKKLIICTPDSHDAESFQEWFYDETGFFAEITGKYTADAEIMIDLYQPSVRIGRDVLIDGIRFDFDMNGCDVNFLEVAACIDGFTPSDKISAWMMGKKKLTL